MKKDPKTKIIKVCFLIFLALIPILFFIYAGYTSIMFLSSQISANNTPIIDATRNAFNFFLSFVWEYFIYTILMFLNYFLYQTKYSKVLITLNSILLIIIIIDIIRAIIYHSYSPSILIFLINALIGLILGFKINRKENKH